MDERRLERAAEISALAEHDDDRSVAVVALAVSAISGFVVGVLVQGGVALSLLVTALAAAAGLTGWWLRGAL